MVRVTCGDLDNDALLATVLERIGKDGVMELHGEGRYVSTVALVVATLKAEHTDLCTVSNVSSNSLVEDSPLPPQNSSDSIPELSEDPLYMTVCLRSVGNTCKKVAARTRSYTTLRTTASIPRGDNSPTSQGDLANSPPPISPPPASPPPMEPSPVAAPAIASPEAKEEGYGGQLVFPPGAVPVFPNGMPDFNEPESITEAELQACMPELPENIDFHEMFHKCSVTGLRPARRFFPKHCKAFCEAEAVRYHAEHPEECIAICYDLSDYSEVAWNYKMDRWCTMEETEHFEDLIEVLYDTKGAFMVEPVTDKHLATVSDARLSCASCTMQGWRSSNEDAHCALAALPHHANVALFGVYDGHGGWRVADYVGQHLHTLFDEKLTAATAAGTALTAPLVESTIKATFLQLDDNCQAELSTDHSGSTGSTVNCVAILDNTTLIVANSGDSRSVLSRGGVAERLSHDHKPDSPRELARIKKSGSRVSSDARVEGMLAVSRAVGDFDFKQAGALPAEEQAVTANPSIETFTLLPTDDFLLQACDGIWDVLTDEEVVSFVRTRLPTHTLETICTELLDHCLSPSIESEGIGTDNMTVNLVVFKK